MRELATVHRIKNRKVAQERKKWCAVQHDATKRKREERQPGRECVREDRDEAELQSLALSSGLNKTGRGTRYGHGRKANHQARMQIEILIIFGFSITASHSLTDAFLSVIDPALTRLS